MTDVWAETTAADFEIDGRGFLPSEDPLIRYEDADGFEEYDEDVQDYLHALDTVTGKIPEDIAAGQQRWNTHSLQHPPEDLYDAVSDRELFKVYQDTSFLASAYAHNTQQDPVDTLPASVGKPLYASAERLGVPPIQSYDAYSLGNWQRMDPDGLIELGNIDTIRNFVDMTDGFNDESWFMMVHVDIEDTAGKSLAMLPDAQSAVYNDATEAVRDTLDELDTAFSQIVDTMTRMPEENSPHNYDSGFRPYIESFEGITYDGVPELAGPQTFRGETGAQSSIMPAVDAAFGIPHSTTELTEHIDEMREYMPPDHRDFIAQLEAGTVNGQGLTDYVAAVDDPELTEMHDSVLKQVIAFRMIHKTFADKYIAEHTDDPVGTGNTNFNRFLGDLIDETEDQLIAGPEPQRFAYLDYAMPDGRMEEMMQAMM